MGYSGGQESMDGGVISHPWLPFLPEKTHVLFLGSFPPDPKRWCMDFFYPNFINDMWRIFGLCLYGDSNHYVDVEKRVFRHQMIVQEMTSLGVGFYDTAQKVRRLKDTASDKDLEVVCPTNLDALLEAAPGLKAVITTGQKATDIVTRHFDIVPPKMGEGVPFSFQQRMLMLYRMPSSSRAYPMKLTQKAEYYQTIFDLYINQHYTT